MSDSLAELEQQRSGILTQILELGDFRSGSITTINLNPAVGILRIVPSR